MLRFLDKWLGSRETDGAEVGKSVPEPAPLSTIAEQFCRTNAAFWDRWRLTTPPLAAGRAVVAPVTRNPFTIIEVVIPATVLAGAKGAKAIFVHKTLKGPPEDVRRIISSFGPCEFVSLRRLTKSQATKIDAECEEIFSRLDSPAQLLELEVDGIPVGDLVYDNAMRIKPWRATLDELDERVSMGIHQCLEGVRGAEVLCREHTVAAFLTSRAHTTYLGSIHRAVSARNIETYLGSHRMRKRLPGDKDVMQPLELPKAFVDDLYARRKDALLAEARRFTEGYFADPPDGEGGRAYRTPEEFCEDLGLDPSKPCVFIMLHALNDYPHCQGEMAHQDFYHWFLDTVRTVKDLTDVNWIFKQHPAVSFYPSEVNMEQTVKSEVPTGAFLDENFRMTRSAVGRVARVVITCGGTAGLEFGVLGIPTVVCSRTVYSDFSIAHEYRSAETYRDALRNICDLPAPDAETQDRARVILYLCGADRDNASFSLLPKVNHEQRLVATFDDLLEHVAGQLESSEHLEALAAMRHFFEEPAQKQYLNPNYFPFLSEAGAAPGDVRRRDSGLAPDSAPP